LIVDWKQSTSGIDFQRSPVSLAAGLQAANQQSSPEGWRPSAASGRAAADARCYLGSEGEGTKPSVVGICRVSGRLTSVPDMLDLPLVLFLLCRIPASPHHWVEVRGVFYFSLVKKSNVKETRYYSYCVIPQVILSVLVFLLWVGYMMVEGQIINSPVPALVGKVAPKKQHQFRIYINKISCIACGEIIHLWGGLFICHWYTVCDAGYTARVSLARGNNQ